MGKHVKVRVENGCVIAVLSLACITFLLSIIGVLLFVGVIG